MKLHTTLRLACLVSLVVACSSSSGDDASAPSANDPNHDGGGASTSDGSAPLGDGGPTLQPISGVRIFYSDLTSGPQTGGEGNAGSIVTLYGNGFGASRGASSVTVGGGAIDMYKTWSDTTISFQMGAHAVSGDVAVDVAGKGSSNSVPFTIRSGAIHFVAADGSDAADGSFATPWKSIPKAVHTMASGDITYVRDGVTQTAEDNYGATVAIGSGGTTAAPIALVAYPQAHVSVGAPGKEFGLRTPATSGSKSNWVIAGLTLTGGNTALDLVSVEGWRVVHNDLSCPKGGGQTACMHVESSSTLAVYGNSVHDVGSTSGTIDKYYHAIYFTTNSNHVDVGWNLVVPNPNRSTTSGGCRAIQFYSTGGADQFDLHVHDNVIHDAICDGINFATVDADKGTVEAYNNVVYRVGTGPDPANGSSNYACVNIGSSGNAAANVEIYNNTFAECGTHNGSDSGAFSAGPKTRVRNNIVVVGAGGSYLSSSVGCSNLTGSNNLWSGAGAPPACFGSDTSKDPLFVAAATGDYHLSTASPALDRGTAIATLATDADGSLRPQGASFDIGAYELVK